MERIYNLSRLALVIPFIAGAVALIVDVLVSGQRWAADFTSGTIDALGWYVLVVFPFIALGFIVSAPSVSLWAHIVKWIMGLAVVGYVVLGVFVVVQTDFFTSFDMGAGLLTFLVLCIVVPIWVIGSLILIFAKTSRKSSAS